jgi:Flp pilus assembly protein TadG
MSKPVRACARRRRFGGRGASAVEFALVVPVLLYLVFGIISFGYMLSFRQALSQGAAEGARAAAVAVTGTTDAVRAASAQAAVNDALGSYGVSCSGGVLLRAGKTVGTCTITPTVTCSSGSSAVTCAQITLDYKYKQNSLLPGLGLTAFMPSDLSYTTEVRTS